MTSRARLVTTSIAVIAALVCIGELLSPRWRLTDVQHVPDLPTVPQPTSETIAPPRNEVAEEPVTIEVPGDRLDGLIVRPAGAGRFPAVVLVSGAGATTADHLLPLARELAAQGVVALTYNKRTNGYHPVFRRDFELLADDALTVAKTLAGRDYVDADRLGLWGLSEGAGWVVPVAASKDEAIRFTILVSAPVTSPGQEVSWSTDVALQRSGLPHGLRQVVVRALNLPGGPAYSHFDPTPYLSTVSQPTLVIYGLRDAALPPAQDAERLLAALRTAGNGAVTVRFFDAEHGLTLDGEPAVGYLPTMTGWIKGLPGGAVPPTGLKLAGAQPGAEPALPQIERAGRDLGVFGFAPLALSGLGLAVYLGCGLRRRLGSGSRPSLEDWRPVGRPLNRAVAAVLLMEGAFAAAVGGGVGAALAEPDWAVDADGLWGLHRVLAVDAVPLAVFAGFRYRDARRGGWSPAPLDRIQLVAGAVVVVSLLLEGAYWEHFGLRW